MTLSWETQKLWDCGRWLQGGEDGSSFREVVEDVVISGWVAGGGKGIASAELSMKARWWHIPASFILYTKPIQKTHLLQVLQNFCEVHRTPKVLWTSGQHAVPQWLFVPHNTSVTEMFIWGYVMLQNWSNVKQRRVKELPFLLSALLLKSPGTACLKKWLSKPVWMDFYSLVSAYQDVFFWQREILLLCPCSPWPCCQFWHW